MKQILLIFLLCAALALSACGTAAPAAEPAAAEPASKADAALTAELDALQQSVQPGTAGSSLRAAAAAASLLDWAESAPPWEQVEDTVIAWLAGLDDAALALLPEQAASLRYMVEELTLDYEDAAGLLEDAGLAGRGPWSRDAAETVTDLLWLLSPSIDNSAEEVTGRYYQILAETVSIRTALSPEGSFPVEYYAIADLSGNGMPELLIGTDAGADEGRITAVLVCVIDSRNSLLPLHYLPVEAKNTGTLSAALLGGEEGQEIVFSPLWPVE